VARELVKCSHCNGSGTTANYCCFMASGGTVDSWKCEGYHNVRCCACKGKGVQSVGGW